MEPLIIIGGVALIVLLLVLVRARTNAAPTSPSRKPSRPRAAMEALDTVAAWPPQSTRVLTVAERKAYFVVRSALPDHMVLAQVPLSRFMKVPTRNSYSEWLRRVGLMSADLVVCDASSQVVVIIDVRSDSDKEQSRARQRHARMDRVIAAAHIPMLVWTESAIPTPAIAREMILAAAQPIEESAPVTEAEAKRVVPQLDEPVEADSVLDAETAHRDPPPSTWFDNLDSAAVPLGNLPSAKPPGNRGH